MNWIELAMEVFGGEYIRIYLHVERFSRISVVCKLVPVQYREYEYGLLIGTFNTNNFFGPPNFFFLGG